MSDAGSALRDGADALGVPLSAEQSARLQAYLALLTRWNAVHNLTAVRDTEAMRTLHLLDCLAAVAALRRRGVTVGRVLDLGSGAGLPGLILAAMQPELEVTCVDAVAKKVAFIRQAAVVMGLGKVQGLHARLDGARAHPALGKFDLITARALATLAELCRWTRPHLAPGGCWMAMKGRHPHEELSALPAGFAVFHVEPLTVPGLDAERCLIWMRPEPEPAPQAITSGLPAG